MQIIWKVMMVGLVLSSWAAHARPQGATVHSTLVNYKTGALIRVDEARTDRGVLLPLFSVSLIDSSKLNSGKTSEGIGPGPGLPEWIDVTWTEDFGPRLSTAEWLALDPAGRQARIDELRRLPVKSARVAVSNHVPVSVIAELEQSPMDPESKYLRLKSLKLYFVWTRDGVKLRWRAYQGCCTVIHEGGDIVNER